ncbi:HEPN domain-containing protein [Corallococcus interemptor]|uniref:HEPN domain-containing protein n=1 Tax=Corallococcus interemptor TaxID=2316720 RepID=UPI003D032869
MRSTLDELIKDLADLKALVASIAPVNMVLSGNQDALVQQYVLIRRRFDYAAFAVALYASFERFVESLVAAYIRLESQRIRYSDLPQRLTDKHLAVTAELLWRGRIGERRYAGMSELGAVKNLFECLSGANPYTLNEAAVIAHDANLRAGEVDAVFGAAGIEQVCDCVRRADALLDWYCATQGLNAPPQDGVKRTVIDERLKDIVERRNQVAHRGGNPVDLLGVDAMNDAIGFIEAFSKSIFALTVGRYLSTHRVTPEERVELVLRQGKHDGPFKNRTIVVVEKPAQELFIGQPVFVILESAGARWGRIQSLRIDDTDVEKVEPGAVAPNGVGVGLGFKYPKNTDSKLVVLTADDDVVWSPLAAATPAA